MMAFTGTIFIPNLIKIHKELVVLAAVAAAAAVVAVGTDTQTCTNLPFFAK
jgi:hypothetical protein